MYRKRKKRWQNRPFCRHWFLIFVPVFKTLTHLPPFMAMMLALGFMWVITTILHKGKQPEIVQRLTVAKALQKIDSPSILFFLGILLAVSALQSIGLLKELATLRNNILKNDYLIGTTLALLQAFWCFYYSCNWLAECWKINLAQWL